MHARVMSVDFVTCVRALGTGDLDLADATSRELLRRCALIDYEPFRCWAAWRGPDWKKPGTTSLPR